MKLFQSIKGGLAKGYRYRTANRPVDQDIYANRTEEFVCTHKKTEDKIMVVVLGVECEFEESPMCPVCAEQYLNKFSTLCASCERPIFPGTPVGQAWEGAPHPYTHLRPGCCETGALYCGKWDDGRLITLHELNPEKYPAGTPTVVGHAFNTGGTVVENVG